MLYKLQLYNEYELKVHTLSFNLRVCILIKIGGKVNK